MQEELVQFHFSLICSVFHHNNVLVSRCRKLFASKLCSPRFCGLIIVDIVSSCPLLVRAHRLDIRVLIELPRINYENGLNQSRQVKIKEDQPGEFQMDMALSGEGRVATAIKLHESTRFHPINGRYFVAYAQYRAVIGRCFPFQQNSNLPQFN